MKSDKVPVRNLFLETYREARRNRDLDEGLILPEPVTVSGPLSFLVVLGLVGVLAAVMLAVGWPKREPVPNVRTVGEYGEP